jgi:tRNA pseudouridine55 synthase
VTEGLFVVDKPGGITSHDVVDAVRTHAGTRKVGHAGTLDPMATGVLVVGVGRATRLLRYLAGLDKEYEGTGRLGVETSTLDADGEVVREAAADNVTREELELALSSLEGDIDQVPPAYSAVKVGGQKLYRAARKGTTVEAPSRRVRVDAFKLLGFDPPDFRFRVECSSGTYVRVLVADVGERLGCGAHLTRLVRTRVGPFSVESSSPLDALGDPLPIDSAVAHLPSVRLEEDEAVAASHGRCLAPAGIDGPYAVYGIHGELIGIWRDRDAQSCPDMVLAQAVG